MILNIKSSCDPVAQLTFTKKMLREIVKFKENQT